MKSPYKPCKGCGYETTYPDYCNPCWEKSREFACEHPYVSRAWIGFSGYCHCYECGNIVEDDRSGMEEG